MMSSSWTCMAAKRNKTIIENKKNKTNSHKSNLHLSCVVFLHACANTREEKGVDEVQAYPKRAMEGRRDKESPKCSSPGKFYNKRDVELPFFEGSLPSCWLHSMPNTRTFLHLYFPVAKQADMRIRTCSAPQRTARH